MQQGNFETINISLEGKKIDYSLARRFIRGYYQHKLEIIVIRRDYGRAKETNAR